MLPHVHYVKAPLEGNACNPNYRQLGVFRGEMFHNLSLSAGNQKHRLHFADDHMTCQLFLP